LDPTLDAHVSKDPRILQVYREAKRRYAEAGRPHHNFDHVMRDLHRALLIAQEEEGVDYTVLIPSVLLHDIGFCTREHGKEGHDAVGARLAAELLPSVDYGQEEVEAVCHCILAHKGHAEVPGTLEAKILYDADVLEKAGLVFLIFAGKVISEFHESIGEFLNREIAHRSREIHRGLYTRKGRELEGGRLQKVLALFRQIQSEINEDRSDYGISEPDLWANHSLPDRTL
jgi:predicted metal-dependent HD superfamily phosphohydrolase